MTKFPISPIFIPANKLEYIDKALNSGADGIIFDLEDSILQEDKRFARDNLYSFLVNNSLNTISYIRINDLNTETGITDLDTFKDLSHEIIVPKFETNKDFIKIPNTLSIIPLIETPLAIKNLHKIASGKNVVGLAFGAADFSSMIGSEMNWDAMLYARSKIIIECSINNIFSIDSPFMNTSDSKGLEFESKLSKSIGFNGKATINPSQINLVKKYFLPTDEEIKEAKEIIDAFNKSNEGVFSFKGKVIDKPIVKIMENRLMLSDNNK
jgi:citrate lyase beta subunit